MNAADRGAEQAQRQSLRLARKTAAEGRRAAGALKNASRRSRATGASRNAGTWNKVGRVVSLLYKKHRGGVAGDAYSNKSKDAQHVGTNALGQSAHQRLAEFCLECQRHPTVDPKNLVVHVSLSRPAGHDLTLAQWHEVAKHFLKNLGAEGCLYTVTRHPGTHDHVHVVYSRARPDGTLVSDSQDFYKGRAAARDAIRELGLEVPDTTPKQNAAPTDRAVNASRRAQRRGTKPAVVSPEVVLQALKKSSSLDDLAGHLHVSGVQFKLANSTSGKTTGALFRADGAEEWLAGSSISRQFSLPAIQRQIELNRAARAPAPRPPAPAPGQRPAQPMPPRQRGF
jgi:Relaxase/Mobilisation nuclease domain